MIRLLILSLASAALAVLAGCSSTAPTSAVAQKTLGSFSALNTDAPVTIQVVNQNRTPNVEIVGDRAAAAPIRTEVIGNTLYIAKLSDTGFDPKPLVRVYTTSLQRIDNLGNADITATEINAPTFTANNYGAGSITLSGLADAVYLVSSGSGNIDAKLLAAKQAYVSNLGTGTMSVNASQSVERNAASTGNIIYYGAPQVTLRPVVTASDNFSTILLNTPAAVEITAQQTPGITIVGDPTSIGHITTAITNGILTINGDAFVAASTKINVSASQVERLENSGSGSASLTGMNVTAFSAAARGAGGLTIQGAAQIFTVLLQSSANIDARALVASQVFATNSGSGNITVYAAQSLDGTITNSGNIYYYGNPSAIRRNVSGSGNIIQKN